LKVVHINRGFGLIAHHPIIRALRENYEHSPFIKPDGEFDTLPCPQRDTKVLVEYGLIQNDQKQTINGFTFFPSDYFSPIGFMGDQNFTENTYSIHHFNASWFTDRQRKAMGRKKQLRNLMGRAVGDKVNLIFLAWDELRHGGIKGVLVKLKKRI